MNAYIQTIITGTKFTFLLILSLVFIGCGSDGSDGSDGTLGATGPAGGNVIKVSEVQTSLVATVNSATFGGQPVVNFSVVDQDGLPYVDLPAIRFTLSKLTPGINGDSSVWQSYINQIETADGIGPGTDDTIQATSDRNGVLENHQDGTYTYTFENDINQITTPLAVTFEPELTHRLAMQLSGDGQPVANAIFDIRPSDGATTDIFTREIVKIETCNSCHGKLALHGGGRIDTKLCVTCHNPGSADANSGNTVDFKVMVHKIHRGESLPSVEAGGEYSIYGFRDTKHDYSDVELPQDIRHCSKCHDATDTETPEAVNWSTNPSIEACGSCHDDIDFSLGIDGGHEGGVMDNNADCIICHKEGGIVGSIASSHTIPAEIAAQNFKFNILGVANSGPGGFPVVTFSVTNPNNSDATYDITADPAFTAGGGASRVAIDLAWDAKDFVNTGSGSSAASAVSINALSAPVANGDGTFTVTSAVAIPIDVVGTGGVAIEGHPAGDIDSDGIYSDRLAVNSVVSYFSITDPDPVPRREIVDSAKCNNCHSQVSLHGGNRNGDVQICALCHNPNNTDIAMRPVDPATTGDGKVEESIDFKRLIHSIHAAEMRTNDFFVYGFGGSEHDFSHVLFPGILNNCETCHLPDTYTLPLGDNVLASTVITGTDLALPTDDENISATAAVCSSCHDSILAQAHMTQNGGASFDTSQQDVDNFVVIETCQFCHGPGSIKDVKDVHEIE
jgi:OmcA/MtrC family decaheme c-type cytochrome